eukprot:11674853-Prorocentrum_lima.AAC.1
MRTQARSVCVQDPGLAAQLRGVFRTDVLVTIVHQDSTDDRSAVHQFWLKAQELAQQFAGK